MDIFKDTLRRLTEGGVKALRIHSKSSLSLYAAQSCIPINLVDYFRRIVVIYG